MKYFIHAAGVVAALLFFASPASAQTRSWEHYDACPQKPFVKMVECGKRARTEYCKGWLSGCDSIGNSVVQYADNLAAAVRKGEMSASTAERRWIEFKIKTAAAVRAMQNDSGPSWTPPAPAAPPPRLCNYGGPGPSICY